MNIRNLLYHGKLCFLFLIVSISNGQTIANYIGNGSFEELYDCNLPVMFQKLKYWRTMDSASYGNCLVASPCFSNVPSTFFGFQTPKSGFNFALYDAICMPCPMNNNRGYIRNRLKSKLIFGKTYCVKFYICIPEGSSASIDSHGVYFGDNTLDTITKFKIPLTYLNPQIQNPAGNIIGDTLNWVPITGTFVANGTEKFCVIGNFKSDAATNFTMQVKNATHNIQYPPCGTCTTSVAYIDDVSCIPIDLPAYAGPDVFGIPGNTVYIGRPQDVGIDEACTWYNITNTTTPIANAAGITVTVGVSSQTYIVKQDICGNIKYDTVAVYASAVGNKELQIADYKLQIYPNPAKDLLYVEVSHASTPLSVTNALGQLIIEEELVQNKKEIDISKLPNGVYFLKVKNKNGIEINRKFIIEH
ncbi:MAG: T9SS type A sorting domain-containing protein [Bacteroidota bacterium]